MGSVGWELRSSHFFQQCISSAKPVAQRDKVVVIELHRLGGKLFDGGRRTQFCTIEFHGSRCFRLRPGRLS